MGAEGGGSPAQWDSVDGPDRTSADDAHTRALIMLLTCACGPSGDQGRVTTRWWCQRTGGVSRCRRGEVEEPRGVGELEGGQDRLLAGGGGGALRDVAVGGGQGHQVHAVEFVADVAPGVVGGVLDHADQQQGEPAQLDARGSGPCGSGRRAAARGRPSCPASPVRPDACGLGGVARERPAAHRHPISGDGHRDDDLRHISAEVLGVPERSRTSAPSPVSFWPRSRSCRSGGLTDGRWPPG